MKALLFVAACLAAQAEVRNLYPADLTARGREIVRQIYNLNYDAAEELALKLEADHPADPFGPALRARSLWSRQLAAERSLSLERFSRSDFFSSDRTLDVPLPPGLEEQFRQASESAIAKAKARLERDPQDQAARYSLGLAYQHLAAFEFSVKRKWWAAYRTGDSMFHMQKAVADAVPDFPDAHFAGGVSQYLADALPVSVKLFAVLFGFRGNREAGLRELELVARDGIFNADDSRTILALLYARDKQYDASAAKLRELISRYPANYLVPLELGGVLLQQRKFDDAIALYRDLLARVERRAAGYQRLAAASVCNRLGVAHRMKGDFDQSQIWFARALAAEPNPGVIRSVALLELGKTLDLARKRANAQAQYRAVLAAPDIAGCHREAQALLGRPYRELSR